MFDDIPEDREPSFPCPECGNGEVTESKFAPKFWECDTCTWNSSKIPLNRATTR